LIELGQRAQDLFLKSLLPNDRILVTGATGWFGQTTAALLSNSGLPTFFAATKAREINNGIAATKIREYTIKDIEEFAPTLVFDFAFITREFIGRTSTEAYAQNNIKLTDMAISVIGMPSVRRALVCSSGAAVFPGDALESAFEVNPYGYLKRLAEQRFENLALKTGKKIVCVRPWSVSGSLTIKPFEFAFSSFIHQARESSEIRVQSQKEVFRRYVAVEDLIAVALAESLDSSNLFQILDSGGDLIDLESLAKFISSLSRNKPTVVSSVDKGLPADNYYSDAKSWDAACAKHNFEPDNLEMQVLRALEFQRQVVQ